MTIYALADLHLPFGAEEKHMEIFGPQWAQYTEKIEEHWRAIVAPEDLVLIAGDISWAMHLKDALKDLEWINQLPGQKVMIKGNHDYWWSSAKKMRAVFPPSIAFIQNDAYSWNNIAIGGARLWDSEEYSFEKYITFRENPNEAPKEYNKEEQLEKDRKIFARELERLELSLRQLDPNAEKKIVMTHYPPIGADLKSSKVSTLLEKYDVDCCIFGHLHNVTEGALPFGEARGVHYYFTSCDYLNFKPIEIQ